MGYNTNGKNGTSKPKGGKRFNDVVFINWALTDKQKAEVKAWQPDLLEIDDLQTEVIQEGNKVSYGFDERNGSYTCSIVPQSTHKTNQGYILVGRGSTPTKAFKQALYIHRSVFSGDWSSYSTASRDEDLDD